MFDMNRTTLLGRLGKDPTLKVLATGTPIASLALATSRRVPSKDSDSKFEEVTQWHRISVWGKHAENCAQYLKKGSRVYVEGEIRSSTFEGKAGGKVTLWEVWADRVIFLDPVSKVRESSKGIVNENQDRSAGTEEAVNSSDADVDEQFQEEKLNA